MWIGQCLQCRGGKDDDDRLIYKPSDQAPMLIDSSVYSTTSLYQAKLAQWPEQCEESSGYGAPQASGVALNLHLEGFTLSPTNPTVLALCIWGREASAPEPASRNAVALPVVVLQPGPAAQPELKISAPYYDHHGRKAYRVRFPPGTSCSEGWNSSWALGRALIARTFRTTVIYPLRQRERSWSGRIHGCVQWALIMPGSALYP